MGNNIVELGANLTDAVFEIVFLTIILGKRKKMPVWLFLILSALLTVLTCYLQLRFPKSDANTIIYLVFGLLFLGLCIGKNWGQRLLYFTIWNIVLMFCGLVYTAAYSFVKQEQKSDIWDMTVAERIHYLMGSKLLLLLVTATVVFFLKKIHLKSAMPVMNMVVFVISILIGIILDIMLDYEYLDRRGKVAIEIAMLGILIINIFVYIATYQLNKNQKLLMENQLLRMAQEGQKESMERMMQLQERNRILRHDLRHYFTVFQELLAAGNMEEAKKYVAEVLDTKLQPEGIYMTGDEILDAVLNHCDSCCKSKGICFRAEVSAHLPEGQMEFAIALLNLLENAIEAEEREKIKRIEVEIYESAGLLLVTVKNRISHSVMQENPEMKTQKSNAGLHGLGRKSVKQLVRDMDGAFYEEEKNGYFVSNIVV